MFDVIENARMMVGTKAIATLSTGYLNALDYAKTRVQGADLANPGKDAPRVAILEHPDVRRSLLTQKAYVEGMRALVLYAATWRDRVQVAELAGQVDADETRLAAAVNDLLLPIVKGYGSERSWVLLGTESLQTYGGSGFLEDYPIEQYVRDAKIDTLYEGTTAIQGQDLFFRKIVKNHGVALDLLAAEIRLFVHSDGRAELQESRELLGTGLSDAEAIVSQMLADLVASDPSSGGTVTNVYKVALNTSRLLLVLGDVLVAWLLLRQAQVALDRLDDEISEGDRLFYEGKVAAATFFVATTLPKIASERAIAAAVDLGVMDLDERAF